MQPTAFGMHQHLVGILASQHRQRLEMVAGVPVISETANLLRRLRVAHELVDVFDCTFLVMIPDEDLHGIGQTGLLHCRVEMVLQEFALLISGPQAAIPTRGRSRLVLNRQHRHRNTFGHIGADESDEVPRPRRIVFRLEPSAETAPRLAQIDDIALLAAVHRGVVPRHLRGRLPLRRRRPWGEQHMNGMPRHGHRLFEHRKNVLTITVNREGLQFGIGQRILNGLVLTERVITGVDVYADEPSVHSSGTEPLGQGLFARRGVHFGEQIACRLGERATIALHHLERVVRVDSHHIRFDDVLGVHRLVHDRELRLLGMGSPGGHIVVHSGLERLHHALLMWLFSS